VQWDRGASRVGAAGRGHIERLHDRSVSHRSEVVVMSARNKPSAPRRGQDAPTIEHAPCSSHEPAVPECRDARTTARHRNYRMPRPLLSRGDWWHRAPCFGCCGAE
jgi:hypothetical protein